MHAPATLKLFNFAVHDFSPSATFARHFDCIFGRQRFHLHHVTVFAYATLLLRHCPVASVKIIAHKTHSLFAVPWATVKKLEFVNRRHVGNVPDVGRDDLEQTVSPVLRLSGCQLS